MGVFLNRTFSDGTVVAIWRITESDGKSLDEQRLAVNELIDRVFDGKWRLCHNKEGVPVLEAAGCPGSNESGPAGLSDGAADQTEKASGEPQDGGDAPFVSVSHTKGWAAVMTNPKNHVGIDIELLDRNFSAVEKKSLCPAELARLDIWAERAQNSLPSDLERKPLEPCGTAKEKASDLNPRNTVLGLIWCAKEAVYKRLTVPATDFENQIEIETIEPALNGTTNPTAPECPDGPSASPESQEGKITAIFKRGEGGTTEIQLDYTLLPSLILVHTTN